MHSVRIGDGKGTDYEVKVARTGLVTVDEVVGKKQRSLLSTITVKPTATMFPAAVGERIVAAIAEGRAVLGQVAA